ncbi:MAG: YmdB family metallophosphoesterase, partial [Sphaerochaetaceae bacterium]
NYHASTTAEKGSMGYHLAGRASAVIGTHSKVLTNDARILERGTAFITDNGRTGSNMSVGGFDSINEIKKFTTQIFVRSTNCFDDPRLQGVLVELDDKGKAVGIETINMSVELKNSK